MKKKVCVATVVVLASALVVTNLWWLYQAVDQASIEKYQDQMLWERLQALTAAHDAMPSLAAGLSRQEVIERIETALKADPAKTFEKEGWFVVDGWVQLQFDQDGRLVKVGPDFR